VQGEEAAPASSTTVPHRTAIGWGLILTALSWLASREVVGARWGPARDPLRFEPSLWARWDTFNYGAITQYGRNFGHCDRPPLSVLANPFHATWCGTAGWLPGYPWLIRMVQTTGITLPNGGLLLSWAATAVAMFLVWFGWGRDLHPVRALLVMVAFGVFPGAVYNFALFPTSIALACAVGAILAATRERFLVAALLMTGAGLCYPSAWFAAVGLAIGMVLVGCTLGVRQVIRRAVWGLAGLGSLVVLAVHDQLAFGHANAYILVTTGPGFDGRGYPGSGFVQLVLHRDTPEQKRIGRTAADALAVQAVVAVATAFLAALSTAWTWLRTKATGDIYPAAAGLSVVVSVLVLNANGGAWNRSAVLAAPCVLCLRRLPMPLLVLLVAVIAVTTAFVSRAFFAGTLV
jgi:hypothetical protein